VVGSVSVLLLVGRKHLLVALNDSNALVDEHFNPLVTEQLPVIQENYELIASLQNAHREAYQILLSQLKVSSQMDESSMEELGAILDSQKKRYGSIWDRVEHDAEALELTTMESEARLAYKRWTDEGRSMFVLTESIVGDLMRRTQLHQKSEVFFPRFREALDRLSGSLEVKILASFDVDQRQQLSRGLSLLLNADRDAYQAFLTEYQAINVGHYEALEQHYQFNQENHEQIKERLDKAEKFLLPEDRENFESVLALLDEWRPINKEILKISKKIQRQIDERDALRISILDKFSRYESQLGPLKAQVGSASMKLLAKFEDTRNEALAGSEVQFKRTHNYTRLFNILALVAVFSLLLLLLYLQQLIAGIVKLSHYLMHLTDKRLGRYFEFPRGVRFLRTREFRQLSENLNGMRVRLINSLERQKEMIENLRESQELYSRMFNNSFSPMMMVSKETEEVVEVNHAFDALFCRPTEVELPFPLPFIQGQSELVDELKKASMSGVYGCQVKKIGWENCQIDAEIFAGEVSVKGRHFYLAIINDITERLRWEENLIEAKQEAEEANQAKDEFLAVVSHELRTPLNPILGYLSLLLKGVHNGDALPMYQSMEYSAKHMLEIVDSILDFTHLSRNARDLRKEIYDIEQLVDACISDFSTEIGNHRITVMNGEFSLGLNPFGKKEQYRCPGAAVQRVMTHLLKNAMKYGEQSRINLDYGWFLENSERWLKIRVKDHGPGIEPQFRDKVFEPFAQVNNSSNHSNEGLGLGLAICKKLASLSKGRIYYDESHSGPGASFCFEIPIRKINKPWGRSLEDRTRVGHYKREGSGVPRVLLVEDNFHSMQYLNELLLDMGLVLDQATNGVEAVRLFEQRAYDLVLMTLDLPVMRGEDAVKKMRQFEGQSMTTPIVGLSTNIMDKHGEECSQAGFSDFALCPISPEQLRILCEQWIGHKTEASEESN